MRPSVTWPTTGFKAGTKHSEKEWKGPSTRESMLRFWEHLKRKRREGKRKYSAFLSQDSERRQTQQNLMQLCRNSTESRHSGKESALSH